MTYNNKQSGFTLIELMMCITIAMTLITVAIPKYQDYKVQAKYLSAVNQLGAGKNSIINSAIMNGFSFSDIPDQQLFHEEMEAYFALADTSAHKHLGHTGGQKESDSDYMLYQFVDKDAMSAPEIAPEMLAMAVVINANGSFSYHCHYYHSAFEWDYEGGEKYVSLQCDAFTQAVTNDVTYAGESQSPTSSSDTQPIDSNQDSSSPYSSDDSSGSTGTSDGSPFAGTSSGSDTGDGSSSDKGKNSCDHGEVVRENNGHGNNDDGVDSSNPGNGNNKNDESCSTSVCIDDEKRRKK